MGKLNLSCYDLPPSTIHPFHPSHPLHLTLTSASCPGAFVFCNACIINIIGFSYHCSTCKVDLHIECAMKPLIKNYSLHPHPLHLTFTPPYGDGSGFSCDVCQRVGTSQWLYRCADCEFDVHLDCPAVGHDVSSSDVTTQSQHEVHQHSRPAPRRRFPSAARETTASAPVTAQASRRRILSVAPETTASPPVTTQAPKRRIPSAAPATTASAPVMAQAPRRRQRSAAPVSTTNAAPAAATVKAPSQAQRRHMTVEGLEQGFIQTLNLDEGKGGGEVEYEDEDDVEYEDEVGGEVEYEEEDGEEDD